MRACRQLFGGQRLTFRQKVQKALVHHQQRTAAFASVQQCLHQRQRRQLPGGVIGLAEENHVGVLVHCGNKRFCHRKIFFFLQKMPPDGAACRFQRGGILRKGRGGQQRRAGLCRPHQTEDEVCRAVAAEDVLHGHLLVHCQLCPQSTAKGVGVAVGGGKRGSDGLCHPLRQSQRADVC